MVDVNAIVSGITTVVTVASAMSNAIPAETENTFVSFLRRLVNFLALNLRK